MVDIAPGSPAQPSQRRAAKATLELLADELPRVRTSALAWRNGLGALLAGLIGFGLVKGRSDVTQLAPDAAVGVGVLLILALLAGSGAAVLLMRAAHGRPRSSTVEDVIDPSAQDPTLAGRRVRAVPALGRQTVLRLRRAALRRGGGHLVRAREG
jgi:hypothetical protein